VLVGAGLFVCCAPFATQAFATVFSNADGSVFTRDELVVAAQATRDYTVGSHDRGTLLTTLYDINKEVRADGRATLSGAPDLPDTATPPGIDELAARFMLAGESYVLPYDALTHLDDVFSVVSTARIVLAALAAVAFIGCLLIGFTSGRHQVGLTLMAAAILVAALFIGLTAWAIIDFDGLFAFIHSIFFAEGTWTFGADSLLIRMYPLAFWIAMGALWLVVTLFVCFVSFAVGRFMRRREYIL